MSDLIFWPLLVLGFFVFQVLVVCAVIWVEERWPCDDPQGPDPRP